MTITSEQENTRLGREAAGRLRLPGPPLGKPLPSRIGSLASSVERFASSLSRPVEIRRSLRGPGSHEDSVRPPRWWTGDTPQREEAGAPPQWLRRTRRIDPQDLPARQLPRAAHAVPNEQTYTPGGIVNGLHGEVARVRRMNDVVAAGSMLTSADRSRLGAATAARRRAEAVRASALAPSPSVRRAPVAAPAAAPPSAPSPEPVVAPETGSPAAERAATRPAAAKVASPSPAAPPSSSPDEGAPDSPSRSGGATKFAAAKAPSVAPTLHRSAAGTPTAPSQAGPADGGSAPSGPAASAEPLAGPSGPQAPSGGADAPETASSSAGGRSPRASFQLRPVASRLAASVSRGEALRMPAALRRSVAGGELVHAAGPRLIDNSVPVTAAAGVGHEPTSATGVVRRLARGRAELARVEQQLATARRAVATAQPRAEESSAPAGTVTPLRRTPVTSFTTGRPEPESSPTATPAAAAPAARPQQQPDAVVRRLPGTPGETAGRGNASSSSPSSSFPSSSSSPSGSPSSAAAAPGAETTAPGVTAPAAKASPVTIARSVSAGQLSQVSGAWAAENLAGGSPSLAGLGVAMPDLLATQRVSGRSGEGPMPSSFAPSTEIRPATAAITGAPSGSAGKLVSSSDAAKYAVRRRVVGGGQAAGQVPLLTPTLRRSTVAHLEQPSAVIDGVDAPASPQGAGPRTTASNAPRATMPVAPPPGASSLRREAEAPAAQESAARPVRRSAASPSGSPSPATSSSPSVEETAASTSSSSLPFVPTPIRRALRPGVPGIAPSSSAPTLRRLAEGRESRESDVHRSSGAPATAPRTSSAARAGRAPRPSALPGVPDVLRRTPAAPSSQRALRHEHAHEAASELRHADHVRRVAAAQSGQDAAPTGGRPATARRSAAVGNPLPKGPTVKMPGLGTRAGDAAGAPSGAPWVSRPPALVPAPPRGAGAASPQQTELRRRFQPEPEASGGSRGSDLLQRTAHLFDDSPALEVGSDMSGISPAFGEALAQLAELQQRNTASTPPPMPVGADLERIVDAVVDRIEERVVDELERRGRRNGKGF